MSDPDAFVERVMSEVKKLKGTTMSDEDMISGPPPRGEIHKAIAAIMGEIGGVEKGRRNEQQRYQFRGIADIYKAAQPLMARHGVHVSPHAFLEEVSDIRETKAGGNMQYIRQRIEFRFYHADGSWFRCVTTGEAMDSGDKAANKCMSAAMKYALITTFAIPEEDPDVDTENSSPEVTSAQKVAQAKAPEKAPAVPMVEKAREVFNAPPEGKVQTWFWSDGQNRWAAKSFEDACNDLQVEAVMAGFTKLKMSTSDVAKALQAEFNKKAPGELSGDEAVTILEIIDKKLAAKK